MKRKHIFSLFLVIAMLMMPLSGVLADDIHSAASEAVNGALAAGRAVKTTGEIDVAFTLPDGFEGAEDFKMIADLISMLSIDEYVSYDESTGENTSSYKLYLDGNEIVNADLIMDNYGVYIGSNLLGEQPLFASSEYISQMFGADYNAQINSMSSINELMEEYLNSEPKLFADEETNEYIAAINQALAQVDMHEEQDSPAGLAAGVRIYTITPEDLKNITAAASDVAAEDTQLLDLIAAVAALSSPEDAENYTAANIALMLKLLPDNVHAAATESVKFLELYEYLDGDGEAIGAGMSAMLQLHDVDDDDDDEDNDDEDDDLFMININAQQQETDTGTNILFEMALGDDDLTFNLAIDAIAVQDQSIFADFTFQAVESDDYTMQMEGSYLLINAFSDGKLEQTASFSANMTLPDATPFHIDGDQTTTFISGEDFTYDAELNLALSHEELGGIMTFSGKLNKAPTDKPASALLKTSALNLAEMTVEQGEQLEQTITTNALMVYVNAMQYLPQEIIQMIQGTQTDDSLDDFIVEDIIELEDIIDIDDID